MINVFNSPEKAAEYIYVMSIMNYDSPVYPEKWPALATNTILIDEVPDGIETELIYEGSFWNDIEGFAIRLHGHLGGYDLRSTKWEYPEEWKFSSPEPWIVDGCGAVCDVPIYPGTVLIDKDYNFYRVKGNGDVFDDPIREIGQIRTVTYQAPAFIKN